MSNRARRRSTFKHRNRGVTAWRRREFTGHQLRKQARPTARSYDEVAGNADQEETRRAGS